MTCPKCWSRHLIVMDSRHVKKGFVRRRRACEGCGFRFTTHEYVVDGGPWRLVVEWEARRILQKLIDKMAGEPA